MDASSLPQAALESPSDGHADASVRITRGHLLLAARALGLGAVITIWHLLLEHEWKRELGIPKDVSTLAVIPVGWPRGRFGPVTRKPAAEVIHRDRWSTRT
jgi:nitroreductase